MQLVLPQFGPGSTVTVNVAVLVWPHASNAVTWTGVVELTGKQVPGGGLYARLGGARGQQGSVAKTLYGTVVQLVHVWAVMLVAKMEMQLVGTQFGPGMTVTVKKLVAELHPSKATTVTRVTVLVGKQVPEGGEYCNVTGLVQQVSKAVAEKGTGTQLLQVSTVRFVHTMDRQLLPGRGP